MGLFKNKLRFRTAFAVTSFAFTSLFVSPVMAGDIIHVLDKKMIYGKVEWVRFAGHKEKIKTKLDTGAYISSLNALDIDMYEKDGKPWVKFTVVHKKYDISIQMDKPIIRITKIKNRTGEINGPEKVTVERRPVVSLNLCVGDKLVETEVNLVDRSHFVYPMLLGVETIIEMNGVVDPSRKFTARSKPCDL